MYAGDVIYADDVIYAADVIYAQPISRFRRTVRGVMHPSHEPSSMSVTSSMREATVRCGSENIAFGTADDLSATSSMRQHVINGIRDVMYARSPERPRSKDGAKDLGRASIDGTEVIDVLVQLSGLEPPTS
jgi:hypothetical protein